MREILFRGKQKDNGEWVCGYVAKSRKNTYPDGFEIITVYGINYDEFDNYCPDFTSYAVDPETIGQYTGLTDKNGTKIFEGDIVICELVGLREIQRHKGTVAFYEDWFGVDFPGIFPVQKCLVYTMKNGYVEVIGNIHDNPELL